MSTNLSLPAFLPPVEAEAGYEDAGEERREENRYTQLPNPDLVSNQTVCRGSRMIRKATVEDGASFVEPMAGQGFNDQFPWG